MSKRWAVIMKREEACLTQAQLAQKIGKRRNYIVDVENGYTEPRVGDALNIARTLGATVEELFAQQ